MIEKKKSKMRLGRVVFGFFFAIIGILGLLGNAMLSTGVAYADPVESNNTQESGQNNNTSSGNSENSGNSEGDTGADSNSNTVAVSGDGCKNALGAIGWLVCPTTGAIANAVDWLYDKIQEFLVINPVSSEDGSPIYEIWKYCRGMTNIVFIIFLLVVIYSQLTGLGITNYGIKKALPKLIVVAVLVNLSFLICSLAVDVSNIVGNGLRGVFDSVEESAVAGMVTEGGGTSTEMKINNAEMFSAIAGGSALAIGGTVIAFETGAIFMMIPVVLGAIVAVVTGLITIALRQAVVALLVMISPLAIVAYMLPNTENLFTKWRKLLTQMLVFYPMFSLLFGASSLAGFAIVASAKDGFGLLLGAAVQIFPLFFAWKLMQMSGTFLGTINSKMRELGARPIAKNRVWADSHRLNRRANTLANGYLPSARMMQYLEKRRALREEDTKNALEISTNRSAMYTQRKIADSEIGDMTSRSKRTSRYTRNAKGARNYALMGKNAVAHTDHALNNYGSYFNNNAKDRMLDQQSQRAWIDYGRSQYQKDIDDENDINFLVDKYLAANKRDENNQPVDEVAFDRYVRSVVGPDGEERLMAKVIAQAAKVESKQRSEYSILHAKYGHNGYNKRAFRNFVMGYAVNDDGWAIDANGNRLKNADGSFVEVIQGDAITKAPEKLVLYDKRDAQGLYYDMKDQEGNIVARIHRGTGVDGQNHDNAAFLKETMANYDIPIADPINNIYGILSGVKAGDIVTPQGQNEIGLSRYSTTIAKAMSNYKENAAWSGAMFNSGIGNRQIKNSAQYAIWTLDSIKKTLKPGAFNTQNPASVEYLTKLLDPDNWEKIFTEAEIMSAVNINNEPFGGEEWEIAVDENGNQTIHSTPVENPTYEQRMNTIKRKLIFPAMKKILPALDRLRTSNTADNQKPGTADAQYEFLQMVEDKWENNPNLPFDPTLVDQDLSTAARDFRARKHGKDGTLLYATDRRQQHSDQNTDNNVEYGRFLLNELNEEFERANDPDELRAAVSRVLDRDEYENARRLFEERCDMYRDATMNEIRDWFDDLSAVV